MKSLVIFSSLFLSSLSLFGSFPQEVRTKVAYLMHKGECQKSLETYLTYAGAHQEQDFELLQRSALSLLEEGILNSDAEIRFLTLFGAGISSHKEALAILSRGIESDDSRMQMVALSFLEKYRDDEANVILQKALSSSFLLSRLEAAFILAKKGDPEIVDHLASLYEKVPEPVRPLFAEILAECEGGESTDMLKRLLSDSNPDVRVAAILAVGETLRDELLPKIRALAAQGDFRLEEACAFALGKLKDSESKARLNNLAQKKSETTRLAALNALIVLGDEQAKEKLLRESSPYVIALLAKENTNLPLLKRWSENDDFGLRLNTAIPLLKEGIMPQLSLLREILFTKERDIGFHELHSPGHSLTYWRPIASKEGQKNRYPRLSQETHRFKLSLLRASLALKDEEFLCIAKMILESQESELILPLMELMVEKESEEGVLLLKEMSEKAGAPFLRIAATLALYRITEEPLYEKALIAWLSNFRENPLIRFKKEEITEATTTSLHSPFSLNPEETSELLIATIETLAQTRKISSIEALIGAMAYGNPKNRYALSGLLMKATE